MIKPFNDSSYESFERLNCIVNSEKEESYAFGRIFKT